jgi:hypothetical protein
MKRLFNFITWGGLLLIGGIILICVLLFREYGSNSYKYGGGTILDKEYIYEPSRTHTTTHLNSDGKFVTSTHIESEKHIFILIVRDGNGKYQEIETKPEFYYTKKVGDIVRLKYQIGGLSKTVVNVSIAQQ